MLVDSTLDMTTSHEFSSRGVRSKNICPGVNLSRPFKIISQVRATSKETISDGGGVARPLGPCLSGMGGRTGAAPKIKKIFEN